jgi:hypothetical protein
MLESIQQSGERRMKITRKEINYQPKEKESKKE